MKKILFILSIIMFLCSCEEVIVPPKEKNLSIEIESYRFEFEGHNYIWFRKGYGDHVSGGAIHDPGCKCKKGGDE